MDQLSSVQRKKTLGAFWGVGGKAWLLSQWFSKLNWLRGLSTEHQKRETTKACGREQGAQKEGREEGMAASY